MAHGTPDYGPFSSLSTIYRVEDLGEAAVRLGSINTHDRRGNELFTEDFEGDLNKWQTQVTGAGGSIAISTDTARGGAQSCKCILSGGAATFCQIINRQPLPRNTRFGIEVSFTVQDGVAEIEVVIYYYTGMIVSFAKVGYDHVNKTLYYYDGVTGNTVFQTGVDLNANDKLFHTMKVVSDMATTKYVRAIVDHTEYDLSQYTPNISPSAVKPMLQGYCRVYNAGAGNPFIYFDDFIITRNEP